MQLVEALLGQMAKTHLDGSAGQDAFQIDAQADEMLKLFDIFVFGFPLGGQLAALSGQCRYLAGKFLHIREQLFVGEFRQRVGQMQLPAGAGNGRFELSERAGIWIFLLHGGKSGGVGEKGHGVVRLENAAVPAYLHDAVQTVHMADDADQLHFGNSQWNRLLTAGLVPA